MTVIAQARGARFKLSAEPNVIPFIDVLLVLLIIFMVTAPHPTTDLRVDLPGPNAQVAAALPPTIIDVRARAGGYAVFVGSEETSLAELPSRVAASIAAADSRLSSADTRQARIFVRADLDVAYQHVVTVMDALQSARFGKVSLLAQNADG